MLRSPIVPGLFLLVLAGCQSLPADERGTRDAARDAERGEYKQMYFGLRARDALSVDHWIHTHYGLESVWVAGCGVPPDVHRYAVAYDQEAARLLEPKFGKDYYRRMAEEARVALARRPLSVAFYEWLSLDAFVLAEAGERQRQADGSPPAGSPAPVTGRASNDPWGSVYRYALTQSDRGFTFISNGPDRLAFTADDIDVFALGDDAIFPLPPVSLRSAGSYYFGE